MSVSRCMGDWLNDTADAAQMVMLKMEEAKRAPMKVMREMRAMVAGLGSSVIETEEEVRKLRADSDRRAPRRAAGEPLSPPSSNTGGKSPSSVGKAVVPSGKCTCTVTGKERMENPSCPLHSRPAKGKK